MDKGHELIGEPTYADAILDRIVHNAHRIELDGETIRKTRIQTLGAQRRAIVGKGHSGWKLLARGTPRCMRIPGCVTA